MLIPLRAFIFLEEQMCAIALIAEEIGVTGFGELERIQEQVKREMELKSERINLLFPDGHACLAEEIKTEAMNSSFQKQ